MDCKTYFKEWLSVIDLSELTEVMKRLDLEYRKGSIYPQKSDVFKAFRVCPLNNLKAVMVGQDPYPQRGVATGILFGNKIETKEENLSPSLQVIKESVINPEIPHGPIIFDNTLESWSEQGVLMINSALTVKENNIGSHVMLWRPFVSKLLKNLSEYNTGIIYVLFGKQAQTFKPYINKKFNTIIEEDHPAYYARIGRRMPSKVFEDIDVLLKKKYGSTIIWYKEQIEG